MMATNHRIHDYQVISGLFPINDRAHDMIDMDRYSNCDTSQGQCECNMGNDDRSKRQQPTGHPCQDEREFERRVVVCNTIQGPTLILGL